MCVCKLSSLFMRGESNLTVLHLLAPLLLRQHLGLVQVCVLCHLEVRVGSDCSCLVDNRHSCNTQGEREREREGGWKVLDNHTHFNIFHI